MKRYLKSAQFRGILTTVALLVGAYLTIAEDMSTSTFFMGMAFFSILHIKRYI